MTTGPILGKLTRMDPRSVWKHEAHDFTRWMADNIEALGEALGIEINAEVEVPVGAFSVDLAGTVVGMDRRIIIENQLEQTDHSHFGQLMTYAAGTDASIVSLDLAQIQRRASSRNRLAKREHRRRI